MSNLKPRIVTRREHLVEDFHGVKVADPYRWLEDDTAPEVVKWMDEQNGAFNEYISQYDMRDKLKSRLTDLTHYARCSAPEFVSGYYYAWRNDGLQNQSVLYRSKDLNETGEIVLDPNLLSEDGTVSVSTHRFSPKGSYFSYGLSTSGSDWQEIKVMDLKTLTNLPDTLKYVRFSGQSWLPDESGFFYTRYPEPETDVVLQKTALNSMVCLHLLGQQQDEGKLIHNDPEHPEWDFHFWLDEDKKWAFLYARFSTLFKNQLFFKPLSNIDSPWLPIADNFDEGYSVVGTINDKAYIYTQKDAPFGKVISIDLSEKGMSNEQTVVPDLGENIEEVHMANNHLICSVLHHATYRLKIFKPCGEHLRDVELPAPGSVMGVSAKQHRDEFFVQFASFLYPSTVLRCDFSENKPTTWFSPKIDFRFEDYETVQEFYESKDGTRVPMFITRAKGLKRDGSHRVLLYGYGGFTISLTPSFSANNLVWLENGGIYAQPCLRGGAEYGEAWHRAGMLESKQNVFDDFIAAGEYLIKEQYTAKGRLGIYGGSNGGLLTGACLTQRPDLFGAVLVAVPVLDMLRYHLFTIGRYWTGEYGCSENPDEFKFLYEYSPLHNVKMNTVYPPTLVMTADTDDRVVPSQARKFIATLQAADGGENPLYIRIEKAAGHGHGKPISKIISENADKFAFLLANLN